MIVCHLGNQITDYRRWEDFTLCSINWPAPFRTILAQVIANHPGYYG